MVQLKNLLPEGVETLYGDEYAFKDEILNNVKNTFRSYGYRQILTPTFEYFDMYKEMFGGINFRQMLKFISPQGDVMVLRPDATIPVARMAAKNTRDKDEYLKFFYTAPIFRQLEAQKGDEREFLQAGVEYFANPNPECDAEIIAIGIKTLLDNGIEDFRIDLGQVGYLGSLLEEAEPDQQVRKQIIQLIESKNQGDLRSYLDQRSMDDRYKELILNVVTMYGNPQEVLPLAQTCAINDGMKKAIDNCEEVVRILEDYGYGKYIIFDLGFTNPLNYYTGIIFKGYADNFGKAIMQGGRYDQLTMNFGIYKPACGFGININYLVEIVSLIKAKDTVICYTDYLILYEKISRKQAITIAEKLRKQGYIVETNELTDINRQAYLAKQRNIRDILVVEKNELNVIEVIQNGVTNDIKEILNRG
ncbi:MAG: ATP phosphoribosyltransferase regulatory subunit [Firmicutes bacterium HGW-Firmicutes-20]|jgi:ATP phosphoribosyltransferase regulatory subunit|nr:MAG: ATP phosphoribosyltransferase regulatory subunit [Firmicutes bacterium HGW-Firmicutes-20]PKM89848.1 MAG: ATP phosphoribosyltransferase regulatory subunit [Firmicutes bacterium HGW-Firmicutes-10]